MAGIVGMVMVVVGTILSPTGFYVLTLPVIGLLGFGGMLVCAISLVSRPRWPGVVGLAVGLACCCAWASFFAWVARGIVRDVTASGVGFAEHTEIMMESVILTSVAESQRAASGAPPASVDLSTLGPAHRTDPWGRPYRFAQVASPRGYTFTSDGADGIAGSSDDLDLLALPRSFGAFEPPPVAMPP